MENIALKFLDAKIERLEKQVDCLSNIATELSNVITTLNIEIKNIRKMIEVEEGERE